MALEPAFYGEMSADGVITREPQRCVLSGVRVDKQDPKWRVSGTLFFVRRSRMLRDVTAEALQDATRSLQSAPTRKVKPEDIKSEEPNNTEEDE